MSKPSRCIRWVAAFDNHGDMIDPVTERAFFDLVEWFKPDRRIHGGDGFDFRWLRGRANDQERRERTQADFDAGVSFIKRFKPDTWLLGNHDWRLWKGARSDDGKLADLCAYMVLDLKDAAGPTCRIIDYGKRCGVHRLGDHAVIHGYHGGMYAARHAAGAYGNVIMGHVHASDIARVPRIDGAIGHSSGCLCRTDMDYNEGQPGTLRQSNGWLYGVVTPAGRTVVWHADRIGDSFILPSEFREVSGHEKTDRRKAG